MVALSRRNHIIVLRFTHKVMTQRLRSYRRHWTHARCYCETTETRWWTSSPPSKKDSSHPPSNLSTPAANFYLLDYSHADYSLCTWFAFNNVDMSSVTKWYNENCLHMIGCALQFIIFVYLNLNNVFSLIVK